MKTFKVSILSPLKSVYKSDITVSLTVPAHEGSLGILANHAEMVCSLKKGKAISREENGEEKQIELDEGMLYCKDNQVTILTKTG